MKKEKCIYCGKRTKYMYQMNKGLYCEQCYQIGLLLQDMDMMRQEWSERALIYSNVK